MVWNLGYDLATIQEAVPDTVRAHYLSLSSSGGDCISCHECERRCPFGVPVAERMALAHNLFTQPEREGKAPPSLCTCSDSRHSEIPSEAAENCTVMPFPEVIVLHESLDNSQL